MSADSLLDTNIVIYSLDASHPEKFRRAERLIRSGLHQGRCCISQQVVQETLNVATCKFGYSREDAMRILNRTLLPLCKPLPVSMLYRRGLDIQFRYRYSFYDSLIIAAALEIGCRNLYSEDLHHGQKIEQLTIRNPFKE